MKRKDDPKVLSSAFSVIKSKCEDARVLVVETKLMPAFIAAAPKII